MLREFFYPVGDMLYDLKEVNVTQVSQYSHDAIVSF